MENSRDGDENNKINDLIDYYYELVEYGKYVDAIKNKVEKAIIKEGTDFRDDIINTENVRLEKLFTPIKNSELLKYIIYELEECEIIKIISRKELLSFLANNEIMQIKFQSLVSKNFDIKSIEHKDIVIYIFTQNKLKYLEIDIKHPSYKKIDKSKFKTKVRLKVSLKGDK